MIQISHKRELENFLGKDELEMFDKLKELIKRLNQISNLTRLIEGDDYWISQVYDSIWPFFKDGNKLYDNKKFIDIGSGCGFPGLAYAITHPNSEIYLIDSSLKKTNALKQIVEDMNINKIHIVNDRVENIGHDQAFRHKFDIGTARAVSSASTVAEYLLPLLKTNGVGLLFCGQWPESEHKRLKKAVTLLNGKIDEIKFKKLPASKGNRNIIFIKSEKKCPITYPRSIGKPSKYPLGN
tara:strand:+ start:119 stop:835 length:717 start_codon:yes stop_codon:yes gene_type:complete